MLVSPPCWATWPRPEYREAKCHRRQGLSARNTRPIPSLLLVEDNRVNQEVALGILEHLGFRADVVSSGASALATLARSTPYTVLVTDFQMPEMDGYQLSRLVRDSATNVLDHQIPIIAMTAHALAGDRENCLMAGDGRLRHQKPIQSAVLEEVLDRWTVGLTAGSSNPAAIAPRVDR